MLKTSRYYDIALITLGVIACSFVAYSSWCGLGFTYDSLDYFSASRSWRETRELLNENGSLYIFHAPLFPVLLSLFSTASFDYYFLVVTAIAVLNTILLWSIFRKYFSSNLLFVLCLASITLSVGFQMIHYFLWTESFFLLLFLIHNFFLMRFLESNRRPDIWILAIVAFMLGITKNTGFFIIICGSLVLLLNTKKSAFKVSAIYGLLGSSGFVIWNLLVVYSRGGSSMYIESGFLSGFWPNMLNYIDVISQWFVPVVFPFVLRFIMLVLIVFIFAFLSRKVQPSVQIKTLLMFFWPYLLIMIYFIEVDKDEIERLLAIVAPWLMIAIFLTLDGHWKSFTKKIRLTVILVLMLFVSYTAARGLKNVEAWHQRSCYQENDAFSQIKFP